MKGQELTRRKVLGGLAAAGGSTVAVITLGTNPAEGQSDIELGSLTVPDRSALIQDGTVESVIVNLTANYEFSTNQPPTLVRLRLRAGSSDDSTSTVGTKEISDSLTQEMDDTVEFQADLLESFSLEQSNFEPSSKGQSKTTNVYLRLILEVEHEGSVIQAADVDTNATVETTWEQLQVSGQVGGDGSIEINPTTTA